MNTKRLVLFAFVLIAGLWSFVFSSGGVIQAEEPGTRPLVYLLEVNGTVNPALADYIIKGIEKGEESHADAIIIEMDTPGGGLSTTKTIIKQIVNAKLPIVVYVAPSGSSASSAGALITMAADVAAMAPGTNIGAAHPVAAGGQQMDTTMSDKVLNDITAYMRGIVAKKGRNAEWAEKAIRESVSVSDQEALQLKVVDLIADSIPDLLNKMDGRSIEKENRTITLKTKNAKVEKIPVGWRFKILDVIANPNVAYILMMVGGLGIMMELYHPGAILPGVAGGICLLLSFFALQVLPVNYVGILLIILSVILFILELKIQSMGFLSIGAVISLTLGSIMLFETDEAAMRVSWSVIIPTVASVSAFFIFALGLVVRAWMKKPRTGQQGLVGEIGLALTDLDVEGKVAVHGEYWTARADRRIPKGERVRVTRVDNLCLLVTRDMV
ncbi:MAG TPA: nodulation protein NfeD [Desulfomonilaceae bacterium]|nr:nodulation protein NfeD [Desulfomonilaceae bacterium]